MHSPPEYPDVVCSNLYLLKQLAESGPEIIETDPIPTSAAQESQIRHSLCGLTVLEGQELGILERTIISALENVLISQPSQQNTVKDT